MAHAMGEWLTCYPGFPKGAFVAISGDDSTFELPAPEPLDEPPSRRIYWDPVHEAAQENSILAGINGH